MNCVTVHYILTFDIMWELFHVCIGEQVEAGVSEDDGTDIQFTSGTGERSS